jgi:Protein of unknown function (DUF2505)
MPLMVRCACPRRSRTLPASVLKAALNNAPSGVPGAICLDDCDERRTTKGAQPQVDDIMSAMNISSHLDFAAQPADVFVMMTDQKYLEEVCVASESLSYNVSVEGSITRTSRTLPAPDSAARFTGPQLTVNDEITWGDPSSDGSRSATVTMTVLGQPVTFKGNQQLTAGGRGSVVDVSGELKVAIPLLGRKLEESAAPAVMAGYRTQQEVGDRWLAS